MYVPKEILIEQSGKIPYGTYGNVEEFQAVKNYRAENFKLSGEATTLAYRSRTTNIECFEYEDRYYAFVYSSSGFTYHHYAIMVGLAEQLYEFLTRDCSEYGIDVDEVASDFRELGLHDPDWNGIL